MVSVLVPYLAILIFYGVVLGPTNFFVRYFLKD